MGRAKWDVQHHVILEAQVQALADVGVHGVAGISFPKWSPRRSLKMMDAWDIERAILSVSCPGVHFGDDGAAAALARSCNDELVEMVGQHPDRFGAFASLPLPDVETSITEYERVVTDGPMSGVILMSNVGGTPAGHPSYRPLYERFDSDHAIVYMHPNTEPAREGCGLMNPFYWWFVDTTSALLSIIEAGFHTEFPNIRYIAAHGGGVLPAIRPHVATADPQMAAGLRALKSQLYFDTAKFVTSDAAEAMLLTADSGHILFASDFPWAARSKMRYWTAELDKNLPDTALPAVYRDNASDLFTRPGSRPPEPSVADPQDRQESSRPALPPVHMHAIPAEIAPELDRLGIAFDSDLVFDISRVSEWKGAHGQDRCLIALDLPEIWELPDPQVDELLQVANTALARITSDHPDEFVALGAIDPRNPERAVEEIDRCVGELNLAGICIYPDPEATNTDEGLGGPLAARLARHHGPVMIHPTNARDLPVVNPNSLDSVVLLAKLLYRGEADQLANCEIIATHTHAVHRLLHDNIGMLYYLRKEKRLMGRFMLDYLMRRPLRGEEFLRRVTAD